MLTTAGAMNRKKIDNYYKTNGKNKWNRYDETIYGSDVSRKNNISSNNETALQ